MNLELYSFKCQKFATGLTVFPGRSGVDTAFFPLEALEENPLTLTFFFHLQNQQERD